MQTSPGKVTDTCGIRPLFLLHGILVFKAGTVPEPESRRFMAAVRRAVLPRLFKSVKRKLSRSNLLRAFRLFPTQVKEELDPDGTGAGKLPACQANM